MHIVQFDNNSVKRFINSINALESDKKLLDMIVKKSFNSSYLSLLNDLICLYSLPVKHVLSETSELNPDQACRLASEFRSDIRTLDIKNLYIADKLDLMYVNAIEPYYNKEYRLHGDIYDDVYCMLSEHIPHEQAMDTTDEIVTILSYVAMYVEDYIINDLEKNETSNNVFIHPTAIGGKLFLVLFAK